MTEFDNVEYFHYRAWKDLTGPAYDWGDGLHHNSAGRRAVGRLVRDAANGCDPATSTVPFWDVRPNHWAAPAISWMATAGLASGYDNATYRAEIGEFAIPVTRGQALNMLWRLTGSPPAASPHRWSDGPAWLAGALDWAWSDGVAAGYPDRTFRPGGSITRAELARMIWEQSGAPVATTSHPWVDGRRWVSAALDWIAETGLMTGWPDDNTFRPDQPITRAAIARLLFRLDQLPAGPAADSKTGPNESASTAAAPSTTVVGAPTTVTSDPTVIGGTTPAMTTPPPTTVASGNLEPGPG